MYRIKENIAKTTPLGPHVLQGLSFPKPTGYNPMMCCRWNKIDTYTPGHLL